MHLHKRSATVITTLADHITCRKCKQSVQELFHPSMMLANSSKIVSLQQHSLSYEVTP
jgi:hypothetical protein